MQHPELTMLIEASKRIDQNRPPQLPPHDRPGPLSTLRARTGNALIALGTRITPPTQRPIPITRPRPATGL